MPERPEASSAPQEQSVKLVATVAVIALFGFLGFGLLAVTAPAEDALRRWGWGVAALVALAVAYGAHRRLQRIRWKRLMKED